MNNRQNNRRRGRGGNRQNNNRSGVDHQNRIDNRARGNAAQMLDKYKKMAQDARHNGDRVNAEYYYQFADHYFRVLADFKERQEAKQEERRQRGEERGEDAEGNEDRKGRGRGNNAPSAASDDENAADEEHGEKPRRKDRQAKPRGRRKDNEAPDGEDASDKSKSGDKDGIDLAVLPPAIASDDGEADEKPKRKARTRRTKSSGDDSEVATAAE